MKVFVLFACILFSIKGDSLEPCKTDTLRVSFENACEFLHKQTQHIVTKHHVFGRIIVQEMEIRQFTILEHLLYNMYCCENYTLCQRFVC